MCPYLASFPPAAGMLPPPLPPSRILHTSLGMHFLLAVLFITIPGPTPLRLPTRLLPAPAERGRLNPSQSVWICQVVLQIPGETSGCVSSWRLQPSVYFISSTNLGSFIIQEVHKAEGERTLEEPPALRTLKEEQKEQPRPTSVSLVALRFWQLLLLLRPCGTGWRAEPRCDTSHAAPPLMLLRRARAAGQTGRIWSTTMRRGGA